MFGTNKNEKKVKKGFLQSICGKIWRIEASFKRES
jgi:hypothetical protein